MSDTNVETVRRVLDSVEGGSYERAFQLGLIAPDSQLHPAPEFETATYVGNEGWLEFMDGWTGDFEDWELDVHRVEPLGDKVVADARQGAVGKGSGVRVDMEFSILFELRDGLVCDVKMFLTRAEAEAAAR